MKTTYMKPEIQVMKMNGECTMNVNSVAVSVTEQNTGSRAKFDDFDVFEEDETSSNGFNLWQD